MEVPQGGAAKRSRAVSEGAGLNSGSSKTAGKVNDAFKPPASQRTLVKQAFYR